MTRHDFVFFFRVTAAVLIAIAVITTVLILGDASGVNARPETTLLLTSSTKAALLIALVVLLIWGIAAAEARKVSLKEEDDRILLTSLLVSIGVASISWLGV